MRSSTVRASALLPLLAVVLAACGQTSRAPLAAASPPVTEVVATSSPDVTAAPVPAPSASPSDVTPSPAAEASPVPAAAPSPPPGPRVIVEQAYTPFATVGPLTLLHPSRRIEVLGFHQSNHDGAQQIDWLPGAVHPVVLDDRERDTNRWGAADIVVDPASEIRAPVTGVVKRAGSYTLYCDHTDDFVVIEPDDRPGWEVKLLHIVDVQVRKGDRVEAGVTLLAPGARTLPFRSQVDDLTVEPSWPHVHLEVVDPSIPDRTSPGGGC